MTCHPGGAARHQAVITPGAAAAFCRDDTLRVIRLRRESHQGGRPPFRSAWDLELFQLISGISNPWRRFSYTDFGAVADSAIWGNGSCRSSAWNPSIWK
jgi:hypothetical protein